MTLDVRPMEPGGHLPAQMMLWQAFGVPTRSADRNNLLGRALEPDRMLITHDVAVAGGPATAVRTEAAADLTLDFCDLGAAHLAGTTLADLWSAGRITEHRTGSLATASVAWACSPAPSCSEVF